MAIKPGVLFLCTENSCRTQMAEAFLRELTGDEYEIVSTGAKAGRLDPDAVNAMREVGIDISCQRPKKVDPFMRERVSYLITLCDREIERTCPIFPGAFWRLKWPIDNPASAKNHAEHRAIVRRIRDEIRDHVERFVQEHSKES